MDPSSFWDERFSQPGFAYGDDANDLLVEMTARLHRGRALSLGEGEGRNARHLARAGFAVTAVDASAVGLEKTRARAATTARGSTSPRGTEPRFVCRRSTAPSPSTASTTASS